MKTALAGMSAVLLFAASGFCAREVVFVGFAHEGAPGIEKNLTRLFGENLAMLQGVNYVDNDEVQRMQARINHYRYPAMTIPLAASLKRCASDSALVIWGMVRSCTLRPARRYFFDATIRAELVIDLTIYNLSKKSYAYSGDAPATLTIDKGFVFWFGPIENAVTVSAPERAEIMEKLQAKAVSAFGNILQAVLLNEQSAKKLTSGKIGGGIQMHSVEMVPAPVLDKQSPPQGGDDGDLDTADLHPPDSTNNK